MHELVDLYRGGRKVEDLLGRDWRVMVLRWVPARGQWGFYLHWSALIPYRGCRCLCFAEVCHGCFGHLGQLVPVNQWFFWFWLPHCRIGKAKDMVSGRVLLSFEMDLWNQCVCFLTNDPISPEEEGLLHKGIFLFLNFKD